MKKNYFVFLIISLFMVFHTVYARPYYYLDDSGNYMLCGDNGAGCAEIQKGNDKATFNLGKGEIIFDNVTYYYDSAKEKEYQNKQAGKTRMYFYIDNNKRYVLCSTSDSNSCRTYTFDQLSLKASIGTNRIQFNNDSKSNGDEEVYIFSQEKQNEYNTAHPAKNEEDASSTKKSSDSDNSQTQQEKPKPSTTICKQLHTPLKFVGYIVFIFKILIPILLIIFGALDFFKGITAGKDDEIKKSAKSFAFRIIAAVVIFFLPTIISLLFSFIESWSDVAGDFDACQKCVLKVGECKE